MKQYIIRLMTLLLLSMIFGVSGFASYHPYDYHSNVFVLKVDSRIDGESTPLQFTIPVVPSALSAYGYNYSVDCDSDGHFEHTNITENFTCNFDRPDEYAIGIQGIFPAIFFNDEGDKNKVLEIVQWGTNKWKMMSNAFMGTSNLIVSADDNPDLSETEWLRYMFQNATSLVFTHPINDWDVSNVTGMFYGATSFNQDIGDWNVSNVTNMSSMFLNTTSFNQPLANWNVSKVTTMNSMFLNATSFNQDIGDWNVSNVTTMGYMFNGATSFNKPIGNWNVSKVTYMSSMFQEATSFNQDIGDWDVSHVNSILWGVKSMFSGAEAFNQDISDWDLRGISDPDTLGYMFTNAHLSINNYDKLLIKWSQLDLVDDVLFDAGTSTFCFGIPARESLMNNDNWSFIDDDIIDCTYYINTASEVSVKSGETYVIDVNSSNGEGTDTHYFIVGGTDKDKFTITQYGVLEFNDAADVNNPTDSSGDNVYRVQVQAMNEGYTDDYQTIKVTVNRVPPENEVTLVPVISYLLF